jgi:hypothetical protein
MTKTSKEKAEYDSSKEIEEIDKIEHDVALVD